MNYDIIVWQHSDGRRLPFNHPDARAERLKAIELWKGDYPEIDWASTEACTPEPSSS